MARGRARCGRPSAMSYVIIRWSRASNRRRRARAVTASLSSRSRARGCAALAPCPLSQRAKGVPILYCVRLGLPGHIGWASHVTSPMECDACGDRMRRSNELDAMDDHDWLAQQFEERRVHLRAVAYRMLGSP